MTVLNSDVFYKNFDALAALDPKAQFISKDFGVVDWLDRFIEQLCSCFSDDEKYSAQKYDYQQVAQNINQFVQDYVTENDQYFRVQARNSQGLPKIEKIINNLLVLQERFAHGKDEATAERVKEIFNPSIEKLIQILPEKNLWKNLLDSDGKFSIPS
ncbi:MAG: hypothetical protein JSR93_07690 [Verrucomicrobia bacterium]|nr:hypothetical protein [Verrucomicrobiota bacterium]